MKRHLVIVTFLLLSNFVMAQSDLSLHLFGIFSQPVQDFGKDITDNTMPTRRAGFSWGDDIGMAGYGYGAGVELLSPVWFSGMQWVFSARSILNGVDGTASENEFEAQMGDSLDFSFEYGTWLNFPIMTGFRYDYNFNHQYTAYATVQGGINLSRQASQKASLGNIVAENSQYNFARDFGYEFGIGFMFNQTYNLGFRYLSLGTPRYDGTRDLSEKVFTEIFSRENGIFGEERSISMFIVTLGVQLFK